MEDRDFFDLLYQHWVKTTGAENKFWMPEEYCELREGYRIVAVDKDQNKETVAINLTEADADFITAVHGCFADLMRRLHTALDESDRLDEQADDREVEIATLALENAELRRKVEDLEETMRKMDQDLIKTNADLVYWKDIAEGAQR